VIGNGRCSCGIIDFGPFAPPRQFALEKCFYYAISLPILERLILLGFGAPMGGGLSRKNQNKTTTEGPEGTKRKHRRESFKAPGTSLRMGGDDRTSTACANKALGMTSTPIAGRFAEDPQWRRGSALHASIRQSDRHQDDTCRRVVSMTRCSPYAADAHLRNSHGGPDTTRQGEANASIERARTGIGPPLLKIPRAQGLRLAI